jgi:hypothetical protein
VTRPEQVAVHRTTGDVYVLIPRQTRDRKDKKRFKTSRIVKLSAEGEEKYSFELPGACHLTKGWMTGMALDDSADPPILWVTNADQKDKRHVHGLWRVADRGDRFEKLGNVQGGGYRPIKAPYNAFITVDPEEKYLYVKVKAKRLKASGVERIDLETGKPDGGWEVPVVVQPMDEVYAGPDGLLYARGCTLDRFDKGKKDEHVWRMDPTTGKEVPFPAAPGGRITYPASFQGNFQRRGFCVAPNGDVYVLTYPGEGKVCLNRYAPDGSLIKEDLIPGYPKTSCSIRVDRAGNIYASIHYPIGKTPEILQGLVKKFDPGSRMTTGALYKFGPDGGNFKDDKNGYKTRYIGIEPFGAGYRSCSCPSNRHDLDGFDRVYVPHAHLATILVLDANFNRITRIGSYGNVDNNGPESDRPEPEIGLSAPHYVWAGDRGVYFADMGTERIVCAKIGYHVEEAVPLEGTPTAGR